MTDEEKKETVIWHFERGAKFAAENLKREQAYVTAAVTEVEVERRIESRVRQYEDDMGAMGMYSFKSPLEEAQNALTRAMDVVRSTQRNLDTWNELIAYLQEKL